MNRSASAAIVLEAVDIRVFGKLVLSNVNWRLEPGASWAIVGGNGSGKTSLLRVIAGRLWPAPGVGCRRYAFGRGWETDAVAALRHVALVSQADEERYLANDWNFTALRIVHSGLSSTPTPRPIRRPAEALRAKRALRQLGVDHLADRHFLKLSRGERRRVLLARALVSEPRVLILDEGAAGLDSQARTKLWDDLRRLRHSTAIVTSHHEREEIPSWIDNVARVVGGRLCRVQRNDEKPPRATTHTARRKPPAARRTPWTLRLADASFFLEGRAVLRDLNWCLRQGEHWRVEGANGSGKTTLLRALNGEIHPALGGRIEWRGFEPAAGRAVLQGAIGFVGPELEWRYRYPTTVWECIFSGLTGSIGAVRRPTPAETTRVETELLEFGLSALARQPVQALSYGERRLAMIARATVKRPRWLLLDEPTEGLDGRQARALFERLGKVAQHGCQVVCASHLETGAHWFSHELKLAAGRIRYAGAAGCEVDT